MTSDTHTKRRTFLRAAGVSTVAAVAGCLGFGQRRPEGVRLAPPENYERLREAELSHPIYGDPLPEATLPDALSGGQLSTRAFVGERHVLMAFIYTRCSGICIGLTADLVHVQAAAADDGLSNEVALVATTFDPSHDTPDVLREYGEERGVDYDAGNWHFLRPETPERAKTVVEDTFGDPFARNDGQGMAFLHRGLLLLANDGGYVERAYSGDPPNPATVVADFERLVGA